MLERNMISKNLWLTAVVPVLWDVKNPNDFYISPKIVPNSKLPSRCKVQILSNHRIKWHILLPHVANQFLRHLSCLSRLPRRCLGTGLQCLGEVHLVRDHVASATGIRNTWIVSGILWADSLLKPPPPFGGIPTGSGFPRWKNREEWSTREKSWGEVIIAIAIFWKQHICQLENLSRCKWGETQTNKYVTTVARKMYRHRYWRTC